MKHSVEKSANGTAAFEQPHPRPDFLHEVLDWLKYILLAVVIGLLLVVFVAQRNAVIGQSMAPTLHHQDQLLVEKVSKWFGGTDHGDIITVSTQGLQGHEGTTNIIKRVVGVPGDTIEIRDQSVYLNGERLSEPYLSNDVVTDPRRDEFTSLVLGQDEYYVLGDNRTISQDSRTFGPVHAEQIIGEVLFRFYPLDSIGRP